MRFVVITHHITATTARVAVIHQAAASVNREPDQFNVHFTNLGPGQTTRDLENHELQINLHAMPEHSEETVDCHIRNSGPIVHTGLSETEVISKKHMEVFMDRLTPSENMENNLVRFTARVTFLLGDDFTRESCCVEMAIKKEFGFVQLRECPKLSGQNLPLYFNSRNQRMSIDPDGVLIILGQNEKLGDYVVWIAPE